jgi:aspartyl/asparaginyl beta-hydroxylase (cupin superfamily)
MFLEPSNKIDIQKLIDNFDVIRNEYLSISADQFYDYTSLKHGIENLLKGPQNNNEDWQVYPLMYKFESWQDRNLKTIEILQSLGVTPLLATFSKLAPNSEIPPHEDHDETVIGDKTTTVVKYHLVVDAAEDGECAIGVGDQTRIMKTGDLNIFDESVTHWVHNKSSKSRGVLIISFVRKDIE